MKLEEMLKIFIKLKMLSLQKMLSSMRILCLEEAYT